MKQFYRDVAFRGKSLALIDKINDIIEVYERQNLRLTLRQTYYQLVSANIVPNTEQSYKNIGSLISDGRLAGLIDWSAIEDRVRQPKMPFQFEDLTSYVAWATDLYKLPRWEGQENYVELWVEKDALAGVLAPIARKYHVTLMVNRGYSSSSAMHEAAGRYIRECGEGERNPVLLYLGDLDPSGEDMVRDINDRLALFGVENLHVEKLALTMEQVKTYKPPPNPAKLSDARAKAYIKKYGASSWEVDALPPVRLQQIITDAIKEHLNEGLMDTVISLENTHKERLRQAVEGL